MILLDTHVWIWLNTAPEKIPPPATEAIESVSGQDRAALSAISVWETAKLVEKGRLRLATDISTWVRDALDDPALRLLPLTPEIAVESTRLPGGFHPDPADQILVATARSVSATLITSDTRLLSYPHVRSLWA
jgi:PIN domain nuclease of toxin-antitoxin system